MYSQLDLNHFPRKKPVLFVHQDTGGRGFLGCYVDEDGYRYFNARDIADICGRSEQQIFQLVKQEFGDIRSVAYHMSMGRMYEDVNGCYVSTPCFEFLMATIPELAPLRKTVQLSRMPWPFRKGNPDPADGRVVIVKLGPKGCIVANVQPKAAAS